MVVAKGHSAQARWELRAISSAVEHLPYKEIVTGSIPVSPTFLMVLFRPRVLCDWSAAEISWRLGHGMG